MAFIANVNVLVEGLRRGSGVCFQMGHLDGSSEEEILLDLSEGGGSRSDLSEPDCE